MKIASRLEPLVGKTNPGVRRLIWRAGLKGSQGVGRLTAGFRVLPDYLIVGTQRGGTTTLQKHLTQHRQVQSARLLKGVHYFDMNYERGEGWYRSHFPLQVSRSWREGHVLAGEASPYYMFHPLGPYRIASTLENVKLIVLLRDPKQRALSHHQHEVHRGFEHLSFEDALDAEEERLEGAVDRMLEQPSYVSFSHQHHSYKARGRYHEQLARIFEHSPRDRVLILESNDLFERSASVYSRVLNFLEIEAFALPAFEHLNPAPRPTKLKSATLRLLDAYFEGPDQRLGQMLGSPPSWVTPSAP